MGWRTDWQSDALQLCQPGPSLRSLLRGWCAFFCETCWGAARAAAGFRRPRETSFAGAVAGRLPARTGARLHGQALQVYQPIKLKAVSRGQCVSVLHRYSQLLLFAKHRSPFLPPLFLQCRMDRAPLRARPQSARGATSERPEWGTVPSVGRDFGDPPAPLLTFLQPKHLPAALQTDREPKMKNLSQFRVDDAVKLKQAPHTSRPRSANIVRLELADANFRPRQLSALYREVVCLVRCDSTDTTLARGKQLWVKQGSIEPRPFGAGRDFYTAQPKWSKEFGGACKLFDQIAEEQARIKLIDRKTPSPREAHFIRKPQRPVPLTPEARPCHRHRRRCPPSPRVRVAPSPRVGWREPPP